MELKDWQKRKYTRQNMSDSLIFSVYRNYSYTSTVLSDNKFLHGGQIGTPSDFSHQDPSGTRGCISLVRVSFDHHSGIHLWLVIFFVLGSEIRSKMNMRNKITKRLCGIELFKSRLEHRTSLQQRIINAFVPLKRSSDVRHGPDQSSKQMIGEP